MSRRILVTGGAGFIGSRIAARLIERGNRVVVLDNLSTGLEANVPRDAQLVVADVTFPADLAPLMAEGIDAVLHIAGQASIRLSFANPAADLNVNTFGTINLLQACIQYRVPRLLFASSMTIYGDPAVAPTPEDTPPDPLSYYAITKYAAERYVHATARRRDLGFELNVTSLRMFNVYGAGQSLTNAYQGVLAIFTGNVLRGEPINIHADGEQSRDFVHVDDVARAWIEALDNPASYGQVINIGTGTPTSVNRICDLVLEAFGHTRDTYPIEHHPAQPGDLRRSAADITRAKNLLGWQPQVDLDAGMRSTIEWAKRQKR